MTLRNDGCETFWNCDHLVPGEDYEDWDDSWDFEEVNEIDGLIEIFHDACVKDKGRTSYSFGAGISRLEDLILEFIERRKSHYYMNEGAAKEYRKALKKAKRCQ